MSNVDKTLYINKEGCNSHNLSIGAAMYLAALYFESPITTLDKQEVICRAMATCTGYDKENNPINPVITQKGVDIIESIFLNSEFKPVNKIDEFEVIATELRELYPKGRKEGTSNMWRGSVFEVTKKLKTLVKKTGVKLEKDKVIEATKKYIESFNGDYRFMQTLPYFIIKQVPINGVIEEKSQLLSFIENAGQEDSLSNNWLNELR